MNSSVSIFSVCNQLNFQKTKKNCRVNGNVCGSLTRSINDGCWPLFHVFPTTSGGLVFLCVCVCVSFDSINFMVEWTTVAGYLDWNR